MLGPHVQMRKDAEKPEWVPGAAGHERSEKIFPDAIRRSIATPSTESVVYPVICLFLVMPSNSHLMSIFLTSH